RSRVLNHPASDAQIMFLKIEVSTKTSYSYSADKSHPVGSTSNSPSVLAVGFLLADALGVDLRRITPSTPRYPALPINVRTNAHIVPSWFGPSIAKIA